MKDKNKKKYIKWLLVAYDALLILIASFTIYFLLKNHFDFSNTNKIYSSFIDTALALILVIAFRFIFKIYQQIWRYGGVQCYIRLISSDICAFFAIYAISWLLNSIDFYNRADFIEILCFISIDLIAALSIRLFYRFAYKTLHRNDNFGRFMAKIIRLFAGTEIELEQKSEKTKIKIAIVGAGRVGASLAEDLFNNNNCNYTPRFFIDINKEKVGRSIFNLPIYSESDVTRALFNEYEIQELVFALPNMSVEEKNKLYEHYKSFGCKIKVYDYPTMQTGGEKGKKTLREFDIEELLFRREIGKELVETIEPYYINKVILITGGGGSIGSEIARQIAHMSPKRLVLLDIYENGVYDVQQELKIEFKDKLNLNIEICSICDKKALEKVFINYKPDIIIHAAAHKHVPLMEHNVIEAIKNNVFGTNNVIELVEKYHCGRFLMVSTDKAVNPTNVMGATKRMCEMDVFAHAKESKSTIYSATRFGNVLGSAGSVIPLFKRQIANGGPITLTDKRIIRYFMTIPEASRLILASGMMAENGELFVLDMGKPIKILELAENMILLSGFKPYADIDIIETGLRPGEKLYEELLIKSKTLKKTDNELVFVEEETPISIEELNEKLAILNEAIKDGDEQKAKDALKEVVPTFKKPEEINCAAESSQEMKDSH